MTVDVLRIYDPWEVGEDGRPLDWTECRTCKGEPEHHPLQPCLRCGGRGSLRAAALHAVVTSPRYANPRWDAVFAGLPSVKDVGRSLPADRGAMRDQLGEHMQRIEATGAWLEGDAIATPRCEGCGHPMSDGTWEPDPRCVKGETPVERFESEDWPAIRLGMPHGEPLRRWATHNHWSPCDTGCRHGGPARMRAPGEAATVAAASLDPMEASWRQVDVRTLGHPFDLRPERLAVLCLRCWALRSGQEGGPDASR